MCYLFLNGQVQHLHRLQSPLKSTENWHSQVGQGTPRSLHKVTSILSLHSQCCMNCALFIPEICGNITEDFFIVSCFWKYCICFPIPMQCKTLRKCTLEFCLVHWHAWISSKRFLRPLLEIRFFFFFFAFSTVLYISPFTVTQVSRQSSLRLLELHKKKVSLSPKPALLPLRRFETTLNSPASHLKATVFALVPLQVNMKAICLADSSGPVKRRAVVILLDHKGDSFSSLVTYSITM